MDPIVSTHWLSGAGPDVLLVDVRWYPDGRDPDAEFSAGHLPGAVLAPLDDVCSDPASDARGRHPLPTPALVRAHWASPDVEIVSDGLIGELDGRVVCAALATRDREYV